MPGLAEIGLICFEGFYSYTSPIPFSVSFVTFWLSLGYCPWRIFNDFLPFTFQNYLVDWKHLRKNKRGEKQERVILGQCHYVHMHVNSIIDVLLKIWIPNDRTHKVNMWSTVLVFAILCWKWSRMRFIILLYLFCR